MLQPELVDELEPVEVIGDPHVRERVCVFTIHDGDLVPRRILGADAEEILAHPEVRAAYLRERDWGADLVAATLAAELGLANHLRVRLARVVLDFGRFPGVSGDEPYERRKAIYPPVAGLLSREARHRLITEGYDHISRDLTPRLGKAQITLAVHTYDGAARGDESDRSAARLVRRSLVYPCQDGSPDFFDALFPEVLCGATCNKSLMLQTVLNGGDVAPYVMPYGSVESRVQVWHFFRFLRARFETARPAAASRSGYRQIWNMLTDVTHRSCDNECLRGYLHSYRAAPPGREELYADAERAYDEIASYLREHGAELIDGYRFAPERPSCIGLEVRKDLLYDLDHDAGRVVPRRDAHDVARDVARQVAAAVRDHLQAFYPGDRPAAGATASGEPVAVL